MSRLYRVKSFDNFIVELKGLKPEAVAVQARQIPDSGLFSTTESQAVGILGIWQSGLGYAALKPNERRDYFERLFTGFQSEYGFGDRLERNLNVIKCLLAAEVKVELLKSELPNTDIYIAGSDPSIRLSADQLQQLHDDAKQFKVTSPLALEN